MLAEDIAKSIGQCQNPLLNEFFSSHNIKLIQTQLKQGVYCRTGLKIGDQSQDTVVTIMRALYALHSRNVMTTREVPEEVTRLNNIVLRELIQQASDNATAYLGYVRDSTQPLKPMDRAMNTSTKGTNTFSLFPKLG
jgi:hypothetical protein